MTLSRRIGSSLVVGVAFLMALLPLLTRFDPIVAILLLIALPAGLFWGLKSIEDPFWVALPLCLSAFLRLKNNPNDLKELQSPARTFVERNYSRSSQAAQMVDFVDSLDL